MKESEKKLCDLVMEMGRIIRLLDPAGEWVEWWTNDGNEYGPEYNHGLNRLGYGVEDLKLEQHEEDEKENKHGSD